jgi:hypothetical protein
MAKISTYPIDATLSASDLLIGTDADNMNATKNYTLGSIAAFIQSLAPANTLQEVLDAGNSATQDISLTGDITILGGANIITSPNASFGKIVLTGRFVDGAASVGLYGQALTSTGTDTRWNTIDLTAVLQQGNSSVYSITLTGSASLSAPTVEATQALIVGGTLEDSASSYGTNGQLLMSTASATEWTTIGIQEILDANNSATQDLTLVGQISTQNLWVQAALYDSTGFAGTNGQLLVTTGGTLTTLWTTVDLDYVLGQGNIATQGIQLTSYLKDVLGNNGTLGQVLTATASNTVKWTSLGLQNILDANNTAIEDINLTGTITVDNIVSNTDIKLLGTITDGNTSIGTPGQVLTATGGNVLWEDAEAAFTSYRGSFYSLVDQTLTAPNTAKAIILGSTDVAATNGVSITSDGANLTRITFAHAGVYNVVFSAQLENAAGSSQTASFWLRKNGLILADNVPDTNGKVELQGGTNHAMAAWNYFIDVNAGDFIHLMFAATSTNISLVHDAASGPSPATPSVIVTVNKV